MSLTEDQAKSCYGEWWVDYRTMLAVGIKAVDARGVKVPAVRACRAVDGGIEVRVLVRQSDTPAGTLVQRVNGAYEAVEFTATIRGGRIVRKEL